MLFNSFAYLLFFPTAVLLYYLTPHRFRWLLLLVLSCYFYMVYVPKYILPLFLIILIDYCAALGIESSPSQKRKQAFLALSIAGNLGLLAVFKYFDWFMVNLEWLTSVVGTPVHLTRLAWILPIGLSFHTFQSIAYTIDVYRGQFKAERHLGIFANYVLFFPQMVAGPIERPAKLLPQFRRPAVFRYDNAVTGLRWMLSGFIKKCLIADNLASYSDHVFGGLGASTTSAIVLATIFYTFQVYCDFCGYSEIALGSAKVLGIDLVRNFDSPFLATSVQDYWRRWHISLSSWFRDYVYIPLGGNRAGPFRQKLNVYIVFLLSGLWHGANWTFVVWGWLHATFLVAGKVLVKPAQTPRWWRKAAGWALTVLLVCISRIYYRADTVGHATTAFLRVLDVTSYRVATVLSDLSPLAVTNLVLIACLLVYEKWGPGLADWYFHCHPALRWTGYYAAIALIMVFGRFEGTQFVYFQF